MSNVTVNCNYCHGSGSITSGLYRKPCPVCDGRGQVIFIMTPESEIVDCKFCSRSGSITSGLYRKPCPACKGIGKVQVNIPPGSKLIDCKYCRGSGSIAAGIYRRLCPKCKGTGVTLPKIINPRVQNTRNNPQIIQSKQAHTFEYDIAISFAGEDRPTARSYANSLTKNGITVFFDEYMEAELWGEDLYTRFDEIYRTKARYCVLFISQNYAKKLWTNHERQSAQARAFKENKSYILPVRLDDTVIPGVRETTGYVDLRNHSIDHLVRLTISKLQTRS